MENYLEKRMNNILFAIRKGLLEKKEAYDQFVGYTKALTEFGIITLDTAKQYRAELAKVLY